MIYTVHQAKTQLSRLIKKALEGEEIIIFNRHKPVIKLTAICQPERKLGFMGKGGWISKDFNEPLEDFKEYM